MQISYIKHTNIDKALWDNTINSASNGNIYSFSWYLDAVCPGWEALVTKDYKSIMPLTAKKKYGFSYLYRPLLSQQLGVFSTNPLKTSDVDLFLSSIPSKFKLIQICLNSSNKPSEQFNIKPHATYILDLKPEYSIIQRNFKENHRRNIKKAMSEGLRIIEDIDHDIFIHLLSRDNSPGGRILAEKSKLLVLRSLMDNMQNKSALKIIGANDDEGNTLAAVLFGYSHNNWTYLAPVNTEDGKRKRALFAIINHLIKNRSGRDEILDFEGSDIPGLAQFYSGFGSNKLIYNEFRANKLPWPIKYLK